MTNPLLANTAFPNFSQFKPIHLEPALDEVLAQNRTRIAQLLQAQQTYTWDNLVQPLEDMEEKLGQLWSTASHLNSVMNSKELRAVYNACLPRLTSYHTEIGQNADLYRAFQQIAESSAFQQLNSAQQQSLKYSLRDFKLSGVALSKPDQQAFQAIQERLAELGSKFEEQVLDATDAWSRLVTDVAELSGLPEHALIEAKEAAIRDQQQGWLLTLKAPCYLAVMEYAENAVLRQEFYTAYVTRASDQGPGAGRWDNSEIMSEIVNLRQKEAELLGYQHYSDLSLATKMAKSPQLVIAFLQDLGKRSKPKAEAEMAELRQFAKEKFAIDELKPWDIAYFSEKLRQQQYDISQEELRPYFPENKVVAGLFHIVQRLFNITIIPQSNVETWHKDVRVFAVQDAAKHVLGYFYMDLYARPQKRGGAWVNEWSSRHRKQQGEVQLPVVFLTCNFSGPTQDKPALFSHDEVVTLFHEFGHNLHHLLSTVELASVSGIHGVPWDGVEFPSQFLENWCWQPEALALISGHYQTQQPLPAELYNKLVASRHFQTGMQMVRQIELSLFDFCLHHEVTAVTPTKIQALLDDLRSKYTVTPIASFNRFQHGFTHIFGGGYAAGYYSYKWAEVLASDAFARFEEDGVFNAATGKAFVETILQPGGSCDFIELFTRFRGREPSIDALLRHSGIN